MMHLSPHSTFGMHKLRVMPDNGKNSSLDPRIETTMSLDAFEDDDDFVTETSVPKDDSFTELERTINTMENDHICLHPKHCHSFQQVNFMVSLSKCAGCQQRIQTLVFGIGSNESNQVVRCVACGAVAHRTCALSRDVQWTTVCPVNAAQLSSNNSSPVTTVSCPDEHLEKSFNEKDEDDFCSLEAVVDDNAKEKTTDEAEAAETLVWTQEGPPQHWANSKSLEAMIPTIAVPASDEHGEADEDDTQVNVTPLHHANHPFASVSRALQENILAHFRKSQNGDDDSKKESSPVVSHEKECTKALETKSEPCHAVPERENSFAKFASETYDVVRMSVNAPRKMGAAVVAGSIAGGVAGLAIAGPAGAFAGYKLGQSAGALGVILEGSVSIGVFVASVATGSFTGKQIQDQIEERRILTMGEDGTSRKVLLVRPNIQIDPVWDQICADARRNAPKDTSGFTLLPNANAASRDRYRRDSDIVKTAEEEIPTKEKVFLLVSRILNDKTSLPGHVYRSLIQTFRDRLEERKTLLEKKASVTAVSPRARRDDAHAVIKHVTGTLLEVRPGFGSTPALTESTATAVESLVFGQIYELVVEEIVAETLERDSALMEKICRFAQERTEDDDDNLISTLAIEALGMMPESHSAVDKLHYCVRFLELVSEHFSDGTICADSLLKLVCQHIVKAKLAHMNAEVAFLEEFARDEQLLRGREGYALVTLQASLHFLNMSSDFEKDIFDQDDDEENVPVGSEMDPHTEK